MYQTVIPRSVRLSEAPSHGQPIATYAPDSKGAKAYRAFADEFLARSRRAHVPVEDWGHTESSATAHPVSIGTPVMAPDASGSDGRTTEDGIDLVAPGVGLR